ncbi:MAG: hypothetical protein CL840_21465 [Crocinitomicaceae bacterium]|nr:hypothetical protein [Crocinitomicaceae bacterium]|tara:strand:+ start:14166 stop:14723 length:558 start_codon:yes stop_codon:yes gene_type:complete
MFKDPKSISIKAPEEVLTDLEVVVYAEHLVDGSWVFYSKKTMDKDDLLISVSMSELLNVDSSINSISYLKKGDSAIRLSAKHNWKNSYELANKRIEDILAGHNEWQGNQYNPGHFTGGNIPNWMHEPGNKTAFGLLYLIPGIIGLCVLPFVIFDNWSIKNWEGNIMLLILIPLILGVGIRYILKK